MNTCSACYRANPKHTCAGCTQVLYCGAECAKGDWKKHQKTCKTIDASLTFLLYGERDDFENIWNELLIAYDGSFRSILEDFESYYEDELDPEKAFAFIRDLLRWALSDESNNFLERNNIDRKIFYKLLLDNARTDPMKELIQTLGERTHRVRMFHDYKQPWWNKRNSDLFKRPNLDSYDEEMIDEFNKKNEARVVIDLTKDSEQSDVQPMDIDRISLTESDDSDAFKGFMNDLNL